MISCSSLEEVRIVFILSVPRNRETMIDGYMISVLTVEEIGQCNEHIEDNPCYLYDRFSYRGLVRSSRYTVIAREDSVINMINVPTIQEIGLVLVLLV